MDAREALTELTQRSNEVERAVIADESGEALAATAGAPGARLARLGGELLRSAAQVRRGGDVDRVEVALAAGSVFVLRANGLIAVATTTPEPVSALVVHDLRACLEQVEVPAVASPGAADA